MRPIGTTTLPVGGDAPVSLSLVQGPVVSEARQVRQDADCFRQCVA